MAGGCHRTRFPAIEREGKSTNFWAKTCAATTACSFRRLQRANLVRSLCPGAEGGHRRGRWIKTTRTKLVLGGQSATVSSVLRRTVTSDPSSARLKSCSLVLPLHTAHLSRLALVASAQTRIPRWSQMARSNVRRDAIRVAKGSMWTYTTTEDLIVTTADETK